MSADSPVLEVVNDLEAVAGEWDQLADRSHASPFARPGWVRAWRLAFGRGPLVLVTVRAADELVGIVPLERRRWRLRSPANEHSPEAALVAANADVVHTLARAIFSSRSPAVAIGPVERSSPVVAAAEECARDAGYRHGIEIVARPPYVRGRSTLANYERAVSRNLRHDVERRLRRLSELGAVSVQVCDGSEGLAGLLEEGFRVEHAGWKGARGTAIVSRASTRDFYSEVARWATSWGGLRLAFLRLDGRPIAFQFDLESDRTYYSLKIGYDPAFAPFSPGKLLAYAMVRRAMARGLSTYELLGTDEPWKERWADERRERVAVHAFSSTLRGRSTELAFLARRSLARRGVVRRRVGGLPRR